jgi:allantoinase
MADLLIRGGTLVTPVGPLAMDLAVEDGIISAIGAGLDSAAEVIEAAGLTIFPGMIDVHVHFNEPGHTEWEGGRTGSRALAAGGGTLFFDMPLNSIPCTVNAREFDRKCEALEKAAVTDFALWGGLIPGNIGEMEELAERGVVGFKAFLCHSGLDEFPRVDDLTLWEGLKEAARLGLPVAIHAENHELIAALSARMLAEGRRGVRDFLDSRPVVAELEAIQRATLLAGEAGAKLHVIHISSGRGVAIAAEAKARGVDVSIETCPHYLFFTDEDVERLGALAKCAPPIRDTKEQNNLWEEMMRGTVDIVASDHSPSSPDRKAGEFWNAWGGIAGVQSTLSVLLDRAYHGRGLPLERIASLVAAEPARRFRIPDRGAIAVGAIADLVLLDLAERFVLKHEDLLQRHPLSPYLGAAFRGVVKQTLRRGETIFAEGKASERGGGKLVRPQRENRE